MKVVYSFCMFKNYYGTLPTVLKSFHGLFPSNWEFRLHTDRPVFDHPEWKIVQAWADHGLLKIIPITTAPDYTRAMLWRLMPLWDQTVDFTFCRDLDSMPILRDRQACHEFILSECAVHGINDNPAHGVPLMGGMVGFRNAAVRQFVMSNFDEFVNHYGSRNWSKHGSDQDFLNSTFWPRFKARTMIHALETLVDPNYTKPRIDYGGEYQRRPEFKSYQFSDIPDRTPTNRFMNYLGACGSAVHQTTIEQWYDEHPSGRIQEMNQVRRNHES